MITKADGNVKSRHDYLPFGEDVHDGVGGRTVGQGYGQLDSSRKKWATYERDDETSLDYAQTRYYSNALGRFTSPDKPFAGQFSKNPQSWNMYQYVLNNPLNFIDPFGLSHWELSPDGQSHFVGDKDREYNKDLNAKWDAKKQIWDFLPNGTRPPQNTYLEIIIWKPSTGHIASLFGHVSYSINGVSYSWERGGWRKEPIQKYLRDNTGREGWGYVLGDENDPDWADELAERIKAFKGDGESLIPGFGPYGLVQDNCGEAFCSAVNRMTVRLPHNSATAPAEHQAYIIRQLRPYIRAINHYVQSSVPRTRRVDERGGWTGTGRTTWE